MEWTETLDAPKKFGTFTGVFLPSVLTIFGVILYLRMGWIVGACGLIPSIAIISLASLITLITALSLSSMATNMKIGSGGVYYILSRTFGLKVGSSIGIPLFIAQALSISFYIAGFAESAQSALPFLNPKILEVVTLVAITLLAFVSTDLALKAQLLIFVVIITSLISFFLGGTPPATETLCEPKLFGFWPLFTLFFPAVTGIEAGISMSGDLKNPNRSLPIGTLSAVIVGAITYMALSIFLATHVGRETLVSHPMIVKEIALIPQLVILGIWGATLSSSLSCLLAAPRTLGALANDGYLPPYFNKERIALVVSAGFVAIGLFLGSIDKIAPVLSMFFLISYAMLNFATGIESLISNPSWRPIFRIPWWLSLFGTALCLFVMLMINAGQTIFALLFVLLIYALAAKRKIAEGWEDMRESLLVFLSRFAIYRLSKVKASARSWRPNLLVFLEDPFIRQNLINLTHAITHGQGFLTLASILDPDASKSTFVTKMEEYLEKSRISALIETCESKELIEGMKNFIKTTGMGPLTPNTIVLGSTHRKELFPLYAEVIMLAHKQKRNVVIIREGLKAQTKTIDVWWGGQDKRNSELMLIFAFMIQTSQRWRGAELSLKSVISNPDDYGVMLSRLKSFSDEGRLRVTPKVLLAQDQNDVFGSTIAPSSEGSDLVLMGLRPPKSQETAIEYGHYYERLLEKTQNFPPTAFVLASEDLDFQQILN